MFLDIKLLVAHLGKGTWLRTKEGSIGNLEPGAGLSFTTTVCTVTDPIDRRTVVAHSEKDDNRSESNSSLPGC